MPAPDEILAGLREISNRALAVAVLWHLLVGAGLWLFWRRGRPGVRGSGALLIAPLISVSVFAWVFGNPFNGLVFAALAAVLALITSQSSLAEVERQTWATTLGAMLVTFAWVYPHFLEGREQYAYLIAAPMGLIPCPTLSLVIGLSLLGYGPAGRGWALTLALAGLFYGLFGALRLGVTLDLALLAGAVGLGVRAFVRPHGVGRSPQLAG
ncbi:MAG: hypothetical protein Q8L48_13390 [Archangium sp.]|nr:hypothetical protein [Archangium sp.]